MFSEQKYTIHFCIVRIYMEFLDIENYVADWADGSRLKHILLLWKIPVPGSGD